MAPLRVSSHPPQRAQGTSKRKNKLIWGKISLLSLWHFFLSFHKNLFRWGKDGLLIIDCWIASRRSFSMIILHMNRLGQLLHQHILPSVTQDYPMIMIMEILVILMKIPIKKILLIILIVIILHMNRLGDDTHPPFEGFPKRHPNRRIWSPDGATCISSKFGHQMAPLALVPILVTRWRHLH